MNEDSSILRDWSDFCEMSRYKLTYLDSVVLFRPANPGSYKKTKSSLTATSAKEQQVQPLGRTRFVPHL